MVTLELTYYACSPPLASSAIIGTMIKAGSPRITYLCVACRFTSKHLGRCPLCQVDMAGVYDFAPPRKTDDKGWKKIKLALAVAASTQPFCRCWTCRRPVKRSRLATMTLSQYKAWVRQTSTHRLEIIPKRSRWSLL